MTEYITIKTFPSKSSKTGKIYTVKQRTDTGEYTCDCPGWVFNKMERSCVHTLTVLKNYIDSNGNVKQNPVLNKQSSYLETTPNGEIKRKLVI